MRMNWYLLKSDIRWQLSHHHIAGLDERIVVLPLHISWYNITLTNYNMNYAFTGHGCQSAANSFKLYAQAKFRLIDSCQNGTFAHRYQKTINVVTRWSRSLSNFYALIGQNVTVEFVRKIYAASGNLFSDMLNLTEFCVAIFSCF